MLAMFSDVTAEIFHVTPAAKLNDSPDDGHCSLRNHHCHMLANYNTSLYNALIIYNPHNCRCAQNTLNIKLFTSPLSLLQVHLYVIIIF